MLPHPLLGVTFSLILLAGMATMDDRAWAGRVMIALGLVLLPLQLWRYAGPRPSGAGAAPLIGLICFLLLLSWVLAKAVFTSRRIKMDQVLGGVVLYLNIGLTFATIYTLVEQLSPGAFHLADPVPQPPLHPSYFIYFSLVTLTTVGYGDIVPVQAAARSMATLEAARGPALPGDHPGPAGLDRGDAARSGAGPLRAPAAGGAGSRPSRPRPLRRRRRSRSANPCRRDPTARGCPGTGCRTPRRPGPSAPPSISTAAPPRSRNSRSRVASQWMYWSPDRIVPNTIRGGRTGTARRMQTVAAG